MIAARRDVDDLNNRARRRLADAGELSGRELTAAGRTFQAGDEVLFVRNDHRLGVVNGQRGVIRAVGDEQLQVTTGGSTVAIGTGYVHEGHLQHGYATTAHKAQGVTVDRTLVLGSDVMYREWTYVAMSRGREPNALYLAGGDRAASGADMLVRVRGQQLASDIGSPAPSQERVARALRRLGQLRTLHDDAARELERAADAAAEARQRLHLAEGGLGKLTRRQTVAAFRQQAAFADVALARWQDRLTDLDDDIERLERSRADDGLASPKVITRTRRASSGSTNTSNAHSTCSAAAMAGTCRCEAADRSPASHIKHYMTPSLRGGHSPAVSSDWTGIVNVWRSSASP